MLSIGVHRFIGLDVEARPGPWAGSDFTFRNMLSLASKVQGDAKSTHYVAPGFTPDDLEAFIEPLLADDVILVTHNGPRYDLPFLSGTRIKLCGKPLPSLTISDTYAHLPKRGQAFSASLSNLSQRFGVSKKGNMSEYAWEQAYNGVPEYLELLRKYNIQDVNTTLALRRKLLKLDLLDSPTTWRP